LVVGPDVLNFVASSRVNIEGRHSLPDCMHRRATEKQVQGGLGLIAERAAVQVTKPFPKAPIVGGEPLPKSQPQEHPTLVWSIVFLPRNPCKRKIRPAAKSTLVC
jgi:hypothetical protein